MSGSRGAADDGGRSVAFSVATASTLDADGDTDDDDVNARLLVSSPSGERSASSMSQDADGGPEYEESLPAYAYSSNRPPMNQEDFDARYTYRRPEHRHGTVTRKLAKFSRRYWRPFTSCGAFWRTVLSFVPIVQWLPQYSVRENLLYDFLGGITLGVMHVPQGIAYALLAKVQPVVGLYTSFFPVIFYMLFGTSRHNSIGSFAVVALMAGLSVTKHCPQSSEEPENTFGNETTGVDGEFEACALRTASTLAFVVGLVHLLMAVLRLEIIVTYFSDQLVAGFTTGASVHVFASQLKSLLGIRGLSDPTGAGYLFLKFYRIFAHIYNANWVTCLVGFVAIVFLVLGKDFLNPVLQKKLRLPTPIPFELLVVIFATLISFLANLHGNHGVAIVSKIPTGLPKPQLPDFDEIGDLFLDGLSIAVVVLAVHISLAKMFAKKMRYTIDPGQELYALGLSSSLSSFFPIFPVSCSLGRTLVNVNAGTKTQLSSIFSSLFLAAIIAYAGQWLECLPMAVLSSIVIVALKGMAQKFADLKLLWPLSKIDFSIWVVSFVATVAWDVTPGLGISIVYALLTTVFRTQFPRWHFLGALNGTNDFRDSERYEQVTDFNGICIFRFDSPLLFTNVERFKHNIQKAFVEWKDRYTIHPSSIFPEEIKIPEQTVEELSNVLTVRSARQSIAIDKPIAGLLYRHFVIDCSGFTFVDYMGVNALKEIFTEMRSQKVLVYFAAAKAPVRDLFEASGFYGYVAKHNFYPTIRDAVATARKRRNASTIHLLDELRHDHDTLDDVVSAQPMN